MHPLLLDTCISMTEPLIWREGWVLGIDMLDADHREMVRLINRLGDPEDPATLGTRLSELIAHVRRHFDTEGVFLRAIEYPEVIEHCREHTMQLAEFVDLGRSLAGSHTRTLDPIELQGIRHWFFNHVIAEDKRFATYYHEEVCGR